MNREDKYKNIIKIENINSWEDIQILSSHSISQKCTKDEFIKFQYDSDKGMFLLLTDESLKYAKGQLHTYLIPSDSFDNLVNILNIYGINNFNSYPSYYIINYIYRFATDGKDEICNMLWFMSALYHIKKNNLYGLFEDCKNYDKEQLHTILNKLLAICEKELLEKENIEHRYIYRQTRKNFCPIDVISYRYVNLNKLLDLSNVEVIIEYIWLLVEQIKANYRCVIVYKSLEKHIAEKLQNM